jgi:hypothetical protein
MSGADYNRAFREKLVAAGRCITCKQPHTRQTQRCLPCSVKHSQVTAARDKAKRAAKRERGQDRT